MQKQDGIICGIMMLIGFIILLKAASEVFDVYVSITTLCFECITGAVLMIVALKIGGDAVTECDKKNVDI